MSIGATHLLIFVVVFGLAFTTIEPTTKLTPANNIDEVIQILQNIINEAKENNDPIGYFPALYKMVTEEVKREIQNNEFENPSLMEKLDVIFANRYLHAYFLYKHGDISQVSQSWMLAFNHTTKTNPYPHILEHLLTGMNAHINFDLPIAVVKTSNDYNNGNIDNMKTDFMNINNILQNLMAEVEHDLSTISHKIKMLLTISGNVDEETVKFSMIKARDRAWEFAKLFHSVSDIDTKNEMINQRDESVMKIGRCITNSGIIVRGLLLLTGYFEHHNVTKNIQQMEERHVIHQANL
eukprot:453972_1